MLPKIALVKSAVESLYKGVCTVTEHQKIKKPNGSTGFEDVIVLENEPCRLSYSSIPDTSGNADLSSNTVQRLKLFISPNVNIKPGSKITVTQEGRTVDYSNSGVPAVYESHQEINLEGFVKWA